MSLEDKVDGLIAAIEGLTAAITTERNTPVVEAVIEPPVATETPAAAEAKPETEKPTATKKKAAKKKTAKPAGPETAPPANTPEVAKTAATGDNLKELMSEIGAIAARLGPRGNELARILAGGPYNCQRISELDPQYYTGFLNACRTYEKTNP